MPVLPDVGVTVGVRDRMVVVGAVAAARALSRRSPEQIGSVLRRLARGSRPSRYEEARRARQVVLTVSTWCCGREACLPRSIATAMLCRSAGHWPTWCAGVLAAPPFAAHAWIEAEGRMVDEYVDDTSLITMLSVGTARR